MQALRVGAIKHAEGSELTCEFGEQAIFLEDGAFPWVGSHLASGDREVIQAGVFAQAIAQSGLLTCWEIGDYGGGKWETECNEKVQ